MTKNFKRFLIALACYAAFFLMPVTLPIDPIELLIECTLAAMICVTMGTAILTGSWVEKITCVIFAAPAAWYFVRTVCPIITGNILFADALRPWGLGIGL